MSYDERCGRGGRGWRVGAGTVQILTTEDTEDTEVS